MVNKFMGNVNIDTKDLIYFQKVYYIKLGIRYCRDQGIDYSVYWKSVMEILLWDM